MAYRIAEARMRKGWSQSELAKAVGSSQQVISRYEAGTNEPKAEILKRLSKALGVTISYLLGVDDDPRIIQAIPTGARMVPVVGKVAAGDAIEAIEQTDRVHPVIDGTYDGTHKVAWVEVSGNSMNRLFPDGTLVLVDCDAEARNGDVVAVFVNGDDITIKRIYFEDGTIRLHPESYDPEYRDRVINGSEPGAPEVRVYGKAVAYTSPDGWRA